MRETLERNDRAVFWKLCVALAGIVMLHGCTTTTTLGGRTFSGRPTKFSKPLMSCSEASRATRAAIMRAGYTLTSAKDAEAGKVGEFVAEQEAGYSTADPTSRGKRTLAVTVECSDSGSDITAVSSEQGLAGLGFGRRFQSAFDQETARRTERPRIESEKPRGLQVKMVPLLANDSRDALGTDLPSAGVTPVRVELINDSTRSYRVTTSDFALFTVEGKRNDPLTLQDVSKRMAAGSDTSNLVREQLAPTTLEPGDKVNGFLYFPAASYRRGRALLVDVETEEPDGFSIDF